jgi:DNA-binding response OmpR family regulator
METIMIQEADEATLDVVTTALQMEGYRVYNLADSNENALDMIRRYHPKMVLLDCWLRNNSAGQVSQWIKSHYPRLPLVAFSCDNQIEEKYRQFGFDDYVKKPFDLSVLYKVIKKQVHKRKRNRPVAVPA